MASDRPGARGDAADVEIPLDGPAIMYTGATASVAPERLAPLLREVQAHLGPRLDRYRRSYERAFADDGRDVFLVPAGHWADVAAELGLPDREADALRRAHGQQLRRLGRSAGRREEFETALEIREAVAIGHSESRSDSSTDP
ncbi:hypothetical protein [Halobellus rufus]|uniref:hypothetical protein n=1 Tax=Halobellus rufus TaxID=1448860 RepID=UPI000A632A55|nr:hypothetical protein [Halobellus rufus]